MKFLVDIGHPAHVHYFRNLIILLKNNGHSVYVTVKENSFAKTLLNKYGFEYIALPAKSDTLYGKALNQILYVRILLKLCRQYKIDTAFGVSITIAHLSQLSKVKSIVFDDDDDEVQPLFVKWGQPYATELLSPDILRGRQRRKDVVYYPGYHELAYLHPKRFTPDPGVLEELGLEGNDNFFILRFNAFKAHHDRGIDGLNHQQKSKLIGILKPYGRVFLTAEGNGEKELTEYKLEISPEKIHSIIYYSRLFIGDSQTMTSEAAMLGVPSLRCNSFAGRISYLEEQERKYGLTYAFSPEQFEQMVVKLQELLANQNLRQEWQEKREIMLNDKLDVTSFWAWFIENYPDSVEEVKTNPDVFNQFK